MQHNQLSAHLNDNFKESTDFIPLPHPKSATKTQFPAHFFSNSNTIVTLQQFYNSDKNLGESFHFKSYIFIRRHYTHFTTCNFPYI